MLVVAPNLEKIRKAFDAAWPIDGGTYQAVLEKANRAQVDAKATRNTVLVAGG
jgi:hypothetical protein